MRGIFQSGKGRGTGTSAADSEPVIVALPAEVDVTNAERVYDQLYAALISGSPIIIADFTARRSATARVCTGWS